MPDTLSNAVSEYIASCRLRAADGLTVSEVCQIVLDGMKLCIALLEHVTAPGEDKARQVVDVALYLFDEFADLAVPVVAKPLWWLLRPAVRAVVGSLAAGAIESLLPLIRGET